jgi:hypothetical protein
MYLERVHLTDESRYAVPARPDLRSHHEEEMSHNTSISHVTYHTQGAKDFSTQTTYPRIAVLAKIPLKHSCTYPYKPK